MFERPVAVRGTAEERDEQLAGLCSKTLCSPKSGQTHRRAQFPHLRILHASDVERTAEARLDFGRIAL